MDLKGHLKILTDIAEELEGNPSVKDRVALKKEWFKCSKKTIDVSLNRSRLIHELVEAIDLQTNDSERDADVDTAS